MARVESGWPKLLEIAEFDDGLRTFDAGAWTADKLFWWNYYVEITTRAMVGNPNWPGGLAYVDLFSGPGISRSKESGNRFPGSPLIAACAPKPFQKIVLCEKSKTSAAACTSRLARIAPNASWEVIVGDCNDKIREIGEKIPAGSLTLAFVDPTGLHAAFETLTYLANRRAVDFLILVADFMDIVRNVTSYAGQEDSNLDRVLGTNSNWRVRWRELSDHSSSNVSKLFLDIYQSQLATHLGYRYFGDETLYLKKGLPLYRLLYASRHKQGLDFWKKSTAIFRQGGRFKFD